MTTRQLVDRITSLEEELKQIKLLLQKDPEIIPTLEDPWMKHAGMFQNEPLFDQVLAEIETYRQELDADRLELHSNDDA